MKEILFAVFGIFFMTTFNIQGDSMEPLMMNDDYIVFESYSYMFEEPERLDVVVFNGTDEYAKIFVKRIIGMPGETVFMKEGQVYINGEVLEESYVRFEQEENDSAFSFRDFDGTTYEVPEGKFFVLGDNRNNSFDSRTWFDPYVPQENIVGKYYYDIY